MFYFYFFLFFQKNTGTRYDNTHTHAHTNFYDRFFVPPPEWVESNNLEEWTTNVQQKVQQKCVDLICEWLLTYYKMDFDNQPYMIDQLQSFTSEIHQCREENEGWFVSIVFC